MAQPHQRTKQGIRVGVRAVIVRDDAILLVEFDDETGPHFNLPGGGVEPGESLYDAARREVREETAAVVEVKELLLMRRSPEITLCPQGKVGKNCRCSDAAKEGPIES